MLLRVVTVTLALVTIHIISGKRELTRPFSNQNVKAVFWAYPKGLKPRLMRLRELIFDTAAAIEGVGALEETLKWGQPSYLTPQSKSGTTIRIDQIKSKTGHFAMYVHCQTSLVTAYRELYPDVLSFDGNRGIVFNLKEDLPGDALRHCIAMALTYHLNKRRDQLPF